MEKLVMDARLQRCLEPGLSVLVGSVNAAGVPACCRGIAVVSHDGLQTAIAYLPLSTSHETIANIAGTHRIAVAATQVIDHCSTQLKGTVTEVRLARDDEFALVKDRLDRFADVVDTLGLPKRLMRYVAHWPAFAIEMRVEEIYEQTPGPKAGSRLR